MNTNLYKRFAAVESHVKPKGSPAFDAWVRALPDDDLEMLATAAQASKDKGLDHIDSSLLAPADIERLNTDYAAFCERYEEGA